MNVWHLSPVVHHHSVWNTTQLALRICSQQLSTCKTPWKRNSIKYNSFYLLTKIINLTVSELLICLLTVWQVCPLVVINNSPVCLPAVEFVTETLDWHPPKFSFEKLKTCWGVHETDNRCKIHRLWCYTLPFNQLHYRDWRHWKTNLFIETSTVHVESSHSNLFSDFNNYYRL